MPPFEYLIQLSGNFPVYTFRAAERLRWVWVRLQGASVGAYQVCSDGFKATDRPI